MQLTVIVLALAMTSTTAFSMGGGGAGVSGGVGSTYTSNPAECGGLVCFADSHSAFTASKRSRGQKHVKHVGAFYNALDTLCVEPGRAENRHPSPGDMPIALAGHQAR
jgi:hypothetical protein